MRNASLTAACGVPTHRRRAWLAMVAVLAAGCGPSVIRSEKPADPDTERLVALGRAYAQFTAEKGRPPKGPEDIRDRLPAADALTSSRDGQAYVVFWGVDPRVPPTWSKGRAILGHESQGAGGTRYALIMRGNLHVEKLTDEELRASSFPPGHKAP